MPLIPTNMTELIRLLDSNGYRHLKRQSGTQLRVLVEGGTNHRIAICEELAHKFDSIGAKYMPNHNDSSIGAVIINNLRINVKPKSRQGSGSAGVENEHYLVKQINDMIEEIGTPSGISILFKGKHKKQFDNIVEAKQVGADTKGRKKADIILIDKNKKKYPISLKKDNYDILESSDTYYKKKARRKLDKLIKSGKVKLKTLKEKTGKRGKYTVYKIEPNFAMRATPQEKKDVLFGSDILAGKGCIVIRTFREGDFTYDGEDNRLTITCTDSISEPSQTGTVWFLVRNDSTRNKSSKYPKNKDDMPAGIRILANTESRISRNVLRTH